MVLPVSPLIQTDELCAMFKFYQPDRSLSWLLFFYRFFHDPPCIQELRFGEPRTDQLQAGDRNAESMGSRNRHSEGRVAGEIHRDGVLDLKDVRVENA